MCPAWDASRLLPVQRLLGMLAELAVSVQLEGRREAPLRAGVLGSPALSGRVAVAAAASVASSSRCPDVAGRGVRSDVCSLRTRHPRPLGGVVGSSGRCHHQGT